MRPLLASCPVSVLDREHQARWDTVVAQISQLMPGNSAGTALVGIGGLGHGADLDVGLDVSLSADADGASADAQR